MRPRPLLFAASFATFALSACATGLTGPEGEGGYGGEGVASSSSSSGATTGSASSASTTGGGEGGAGATSSSSAVSSTSSSTSSGGTFDGDVFFSEYVEGSSNNKALEIVNLRPTSFSLSGCVLERYQNGGTTPAADLALSAVVLQPGDVFVICHSSFAQPSLCDQLDGGVYHNGNDAIALVCGNTRLDVFGRIGEDANWGTGTTSSLDATLRRKCSIKAGDTNGGNVFDPSVEWDGFPVDTFSGLGVYGCP